jgi:DNA-binding SARP family transcriptional activator
MLALQPGRTLSRQFLINGLWGGEPPQTARQQVHNAVRQIRSLFEEFGTGELLESGAFGYRMSIDPLSVDAIRFEQQVSGAREAASRGDHAAAHRMFRTGLTLWDGEPLCDAAGDFVDPARARLTDSRLAAIEDLADLELACPDPSPLVNELAELVRAHPLRERLRTLLILALYRKGRQADALREYRDYRRRLADEEGLDPGPELADLAVRVLRGDPSLRPATTIPRQRKRVDDRPPAQLPRDVPAFTGRTQALDSLDALLVDGAPPVVVSGVAGVGKTALAVHWGHRVRNRFPDGQLYLHLRGANAPAVAPAEALARALRALGLRADEVPDNEDEAAAVYRTVLANRRVLVVLDDAGSAEQVRPLLPASPACVAVITSRDPLTGLVAIDGAERLHLDVLPPHEACALIANALGPARALAEGPYRVALARRCHYLPLAMRHAVARLKTEPHRRIADLVADLG